VVIVVGQHRRVEIDDECVGGHGDVGRATVHRKADLIRENNPLSGGAIASPRSSAY
jgi:hypothetical protein